MKISTFIFIILVTLSTQTLEARPGDLDTDFGLEGIVQFPISTSLTLPADDSINGLTLLPNGKILVSGYSAIDYSSALPSSSSTPGFGFSLARLNSDGSLDRTFGHGGTLTISFPDKAYAMGKDLAVLPDGKILVSGNVSNIAPRASTVYPLDNWEVGIIRLNPDGELDISFGDQGFVTTAIGPYRDEVGFHGIKVDADGKIYLAGNTRRTTTDIFVTRYDADGNLDESFGNAGLYTLDLGVGTDWASSLLIQEDGKVIVGGTGRLGSSLDTLILRLNSDGVLDSTFGSSGMVLTNMGGADAFYQIAFESDGKILAAGTGGPSPRNFIIMRFNTDGSPDPTFGTDGILTQDLQHGEDYVYDIAEQEDGKIVVGGISYNGLSYDAALMRIDQGQPDLSFGHNGYEIYTPGVGHEWMTALALQSDGKIVFGGNLLTLANSILPGLPSDDLILRVLGNVSDLEVITTPSATAPLVGSDVEYVVTVTNHGPDDSVKSILTQNVSGPVSFVGSSLTQGTCSGLSSLSMSCTLGSIPSGQEIQLRLTVHVTGVGSMIHTANVSDHVTDLVESNNHVETILQSIAPVVVVPPETTPPVVTEPQPTTPDPPTTPIVAPQDQPQQPEVPVTVPEQPQGKPAGEQPGFVPVNSGGCALIP
ncbi:MAG: DUF11 domain-containing protein [Deltaproteobacteria bacterium]|nr:MAG: DUF11 domain-containing protein [Deltaproteobacteria bacterium]